MLLVYVNISLKLLMPSASRGLIPRILTSSSHFRKFPVILIMFGGIKYLDLHHHLLCS